MKRIRLLIVTDQMEVGGSQRQIARLLEHIDRVRFDPTLAFFASPSHLLDGIRDAGVRTVHIPKTRRVDLGFVLRLRRFLREERFEVVHAFSFSAELWCALLGGAAAGTSLITSIRGTYAWYSWLEWRVKRYGVRRSRYVVSNSRAGADLAFREMRLPPDRLHIVPNGISVPVERSVSQRSAVRKSLGIDADDILALYVGRLVSIKNIESLLRAVALVDHPGFRLLLAGDGPERDHLQGLALPLGDRVRFLGEREGIDGLLHASDYLILTSRKEGLSNTILEAMVAGRPVIASNVGGNPELVVPDENGLLYPSDDDRALAACMTAMNDAPSLRARLGQRGREMACSRFSTESMVEAMEGIYASCV